MYTQSPGSNSTFRSHYSRPIAFFSRVVATGLMGLFLLGSAGLVQAQQSADPQFMIVIDRTSVDTVHTFTDPEEMGRTLRKTTIPSLPALGPHKVESDLDRSIEEAIQHLEKATPPSRPKVERLEVEGPLKNTIETDLERLENSDWASNGK